MPLWNTTPEWQGQDACIIGGGNSLKGFDFSRLAGSNNIACNDAYELGSSIVKVCAFGDAGWFERKKWSLETVVKSGAPMRFASIAPSIMHYRCPWLHQLERVTYGWGAGHKCGWWYNTGTSAINLAANLGAKRIFLLGFDLCKVSGRSHWHNHAVRVTAEEDFERHLKGFNMLAEAQKELAPDVSIFIVATGPSRLTCFPAISLDDFWKERNGHN